MSLQVELGLCKSNAERVSKLFRIARVLFAEGIGALSMVPYGRELDFEDACCMLVTSVSSFPMPLTPT